MKHTKVIILVIILVSVSFLGISLIFWYNVEAQLENQSPYGVIEAFPNISFNQPVGIYVANEEINRLFVVAQEGEIYVFENSESVMSAAVFLDIKDRVLFGGEQGLLGLAFHPNFTNNGFFYVDYVASNPRRTVISKFSVVQGNSDKNSEQILLEIPQPYSNHNGGQIAFGPDDYLYVALGDGGSGGDPLGNGQNPSTLLGSILRIDVDSPSEGKNYGIPADNPYVGNTQGYWEEIYAYGFRNPWRFSFDLVTGWLWTGDVGQNQIEEIDLVEKGGNFGWNTMEGSLCFSPPLGCDKTGLELPIWEYGRDLGISVTGGFVYRGAKFAELIGNYVYGDYGSGRIWGLSFNSIDEPINIEILDTNLNIVSFGLDKENELYIVAFDGKIYKLTVLDSTPPLIGIPIHVPLEPQRDQEVNVSVDVTDDYSGVREVIISFSNDTIWRNITMSLVSENVYTAEIPGMLDQTQVNYFIVAIDVAGNFVMRDNSGLLYTYVVISEFDSIFVFLAFFFVITLISLGVRKTLEM